MKLDRDLAPGVHRIEDAGTNWYLVSEGGRLTVVDTGLPGSWKSLQRALDQLGHRPSDIEAVVLTHGHFDHMGFARRAQQELGVPVWAPAADRHVVASPWDYDHERSRLPYMTNPGFLKVFSEMALMGALWVKGTDTQSDYAPGQQLDVPGRPLTVATPGHTYGHCSLHLPDRGTAIVGDAFVMHDPYSDRPGPCIVSKAATADSAEALRSLDALAALDADLALTGHGPPWRGSMSAAVERARAAGPA